MVARPVLGSWCQMQFLKTMARIKLSGFLHILKCICCICLIFCTVQSSNFSVISGVPGRFEDRKAQAPNTAAQHVQDHSQVFKTLVYREQVHNKGTRKENNIFAYSTFTHALCSTITENLKMCVRYLNDLVHKSNMNGSKALRIHACCMHTSMLIE